jgi:hypothetical protein
MSFSPEGNGPDTLFDIIDFSLQGCFPLTLKKTGETWICPGIESDGQWVVPFTSLHLYRIFG